VHESGLVTAVCYQWRHLDTVRRARELLASAPAQLALAEWSSKMPRAPWWRTNALSGGQILEQGTHLFDMVRHLVAEPVRVFGACTGPVPSRTPAADVAAATAVTLELEGGALAVVTTTCLLARPHRIGIRLFGDGVLVELTETDMAVESDAEAWRADVTVEPFAEEDREFVDAVRATRAGRCASVAVPYGEALRTHQVVLAAMEAMRRGGRVDVAGRDRG
jgi:predicted dehydrogenase